MLSRRDWFESRFVGNPEDRFSRVVACVACSTALGQIHQVQQIIILKTEPEHEISNNVLCGTSKASDQPAHMRSLIRAFASHLSIL